AHQSGIDVQDAAFGRGDVNAFLKRLKEFGKARFIPAKGGNIARKDGDAVDGIAAHHGMRDAIEIKGRHAVLQAHLYDAGPMTALHEAWQRPVQKLFFLLGAGLDELCKRSANNLLERRFDKIGETPVDISDLAVRSDGRQNVIERIDEVAITLRRAGHDFEQLVHLLFAGRLRVALFEAAHQPAELGDFCSLLPHIDAEKGRHYDQTYGQG